MTQKDLERVGKVWQDRLGLTDWTIRWTLDNDSSVLKANTHGETHYHRLYKRATIIINGAVKDDVMGFDPESTIVHELVHVMFPIHVKNEEQSRLEEGIERAARVVLRAFGRDKKLKDLQCDQD